MARISFRIVIAAVLAGTPSAGAGPGQPAPCYSQEKNVIPRLLVEIWFVPNPHGEGVIALQLNVQNGVDSTGSWRAAVTRVVSLDPESYFWSHYGISAERNETEMGSVVLSYAEAADGFEILAGEGSGIFSPLHGWFHRCEQFQDDERGGILPKKAHSA